MEVWLLSSVQKLSPALPLSIFPSSFLLVGSRQRRVAGQKKQGWDTLRVRDEADQAVECLAVGVLQENIDEIKDSEVHATDSIKKSS